MSLFRIPPDRGPLTENNGTIEDVGLVLDKLAGYMKQYELTGDFRFLSAALGLHGDAKVAFDSYERNLRKQLRRTDPYRGVKPIIRTGGR